MTEVAVAVVVWLVFGYGVFRLELGRVRRRRVRANVDRLGPVRLRDGLRASKAAQAAAHGFYVCAGDGCRGCVPPVSHPGWGRLADAVLDGDPQDVRHVWDAFLRDVEGGDR